MVRDSAVDSTLPGTGMTFASHGDHVFMLWRADGYVGSQIGALVIVGFRRTDSGLIRDSRFDLALPSNRRAYHIIRLGDRLHVVYRGNNQVKSYAVRINASSLTRQTGDDWEFAGPFSGSIRAIVASQDGGMVWMATVAFGGIFASGSQRTWYAYRVEANGSLTRSASDDKTVTSPSGISSNPQHVMGHDGHVFFSSGPVLRRMSMETWTVDAGSVDIGGNYAGLNVWASPIPGVGLIPSGGHVLVPAGQSRSRGAGYQDGTTSYRAVRVRDSVLQWAAPAADYATLNTRRAANAGFRAAVMDPDVIGVSVPNARFTPIPTDVKSVTRTELNGTLVDLGEEHDWRFDIARQKIIQAPDATALTTADALVVEYQAQAIVQACNPMAAAMRDVFITLSDSEGLLYDDALQIATAELARYGPLAQRLDTELRDVDAVVLPADVLQFDTALLRQIGLSGASDGDRWLVAGAVYRYLGNLLLQDLECQQGAFRERSVDWWRRILPS